jgi:hypothetical protein
MLDILSPRGQQTVREEEEACSIFLTRHPAYSIIHTAKDGTACVDSLLVRNGVLRALVETKCRKCTRQTFHNAFNSEWLITRDKLVDGYRTARGLNVPFVGFLYLVPDRTLIFATFWRPDAGWVVPIRSERTETQATVNGGKALRMNAFVDMAGAREVS